MSLLLPRHIEKTLKRMKIKNRIVAFVSFSSTGRDSDNGAFPIECDGITRGQFHSTSGR